jgi:biotin carboxyl carrier protein
VRAEHSLQRYPAPGLPVLETTLVYCRSTVRTGRSTGVGMKRSGEAEITPQPTTIELRQGLEQSLHKAKTTRWWRWLLVLIILGCAGYSLFQQARPQQIPTAAVTKPTAPGVPVVVATARQRDLPIYLSGLGSVTPLNTVTVRSRVDGQLMSVRVQEGQLVRKGDVLAEIDARPYQAQRFCRKVCI